MRKIIFALPILIFLAAASVRAQCTYTTVSGTIVDANGVPYSGANISADLVPSPPGSPTCTGGVVFAGHVGPIQANASGAFTMILPANGSITPSGTQWQFTVAEQGVPLPFGTGPQTFTSKITISGSSQSVSSTLSAAAPALTLAFGVGSSGVASFNGRTGVVLPATSDYSFSQISGILAVASGGTGTDTPGLVAGTNVTITGTWPNETINSTASGTGSVTTFSAGNLSPLFTTSVATATTTPALTFSLSNAGADTVFANCTGSSAAPSFCSIVSAMVPPINLASTANGGVTGILPVANGGTATASPSLVAGTNVTITGTWPNQTVNASTTSGANAALSNLTSVAVNSALLPGADNSISIDSLLFRYVNFWASGDFGWSNGSGTADTGISRLSAGVIAAGNGTAGDTSGTFEATSFVSVPDGVHPSSSVFVGNTTLPSLTANTFSILGPPAATFTAWSLQAASTIPANGHLLGCTVVGTNCLLTDEGAPGTGTVTDGSGSTTANQLALATSTAHILSYATTLPTAAMPALAGDVTNSAGSLSTTIAANAVTGAKMANNTVTATQLAAQYSKGSCTELWGGSGTSFALTSGDDAIADNSCYNDSGVTRTITAVKARSDIASNTTTVNPTFGSAGAGTTICSAALTAGSSLAYSSTCTVSNASWTTGTGINPVMGGTLTGTSIAVIVEYTF
jgi:hypothetical protein